MICIKRIIFVLLVLLSCKTAAQSIIGTIICATTQECIIGATIVLNEQPPRASISGLDGSFVKQNAKFPASLTVSFVGYKTQHITVENSEPFVVKLEEELAMFQELIITGEHSGRTDAGARTMERSAMNVINVMSARSIELSPDMTVANVIQRMSGVTMERGSSGDGQYALLRGMDKRYNYTLVNGIKIPSPDNRNRFVPLDIFPSELLDRLEVTKALTADMEGDGIGGAVNMAMKDAPAQLQVNANISTGFDSHFFANNYQSFEHKSIDRQTPNQKWGHGYPAKTTDFATKNLRVTERNMPQPNIAGGFSIGGRAFKNMLGIMVATSYSDAFRGSASDEYLNSVLSDGTQEITQRKYSTQQRRLGAHAKFDLMLNKYHKLTWYNAYMDFQNMQARELKDIHGQRAKQQSRLRWNRQSIYSTSMRGLHNFADETLRFDWALACGKAFNQTPDNVTIRMRLGADDRINVNQGKDDAVLRRWEDNSDEDYAVYANLTWITQTGAARTEWSAGGMYRDKWRESRFQEYQFTATGMLYQGEHWNYFDEITLEAEPTRLLRDAMNYNASEKISAGYVQMKTSFAKFQITTGLRLERTLQGYDLLFDTPGIEATGLQDYHDWLPSFHARYELNSKSNLRFSYFKAINRPSFFEIVPYTKVFEDYIESGNPEVKRARAHNIDLRYELFPRSSEQFMAGVFYKLIEDPIEYRMLRAQNTDVQYSPHNFSDAHNAGLEIDFTKYFRHFGAKANYTYTNSRIKTPKWEVTEADDDASENIVYIWVEQIRPLSGQAAHVANFSLLYKNIKSGWDAQLALSYTDKRLVGISRYIDRDTWQAGHLRLDASVEKHFTGTGFTLFAKASNLLDTPMYQFINPNEAHRNLVGRARKNGGLLDRKENYGRHVTVGVKFKI